jgi:hypothetical protein
MYNIKCFVIPVIIGATGIVTKGLKISRNNTRKAFNRFCTKNSCTKDIAHNKETSTTCNLEPVVGYTIDSRIIISSTPKPQK